MARPTEMAEDEVRLLKLMVGEQAAQIRVLSDLGHYLVQAHFAFRERHFQLAEQHNVLVKALFSKKVIFKEDLCGQAPFGTCDSMFCNLMCEPDISRAVAFMAGENLVRKLLLTSSRLGASISFALSQSEAYHQVCTADLEEVDRRVQEEIAAGSFATGGFAASGLDWRDPRGGLPCIRREPREGLAALLQEALQNAWLAETFAVALGPVSGARLSRASRNCCDWMRLVTSRLSRMRPPAPKGDPNVATLRQTIRTSLPQAFHNQGDFPGLERGFVVDEPDRTLSLLDHLWQDTSLAETLKGCMGPEGVRAFRLVSRGGCECMRPSVWFRPMDESSSEISFNPRSSHDADTEIESISDMGDRRRRNLRSNDSHHGDDEDDDHRAFVNLLKTMQAGDQKGRRAAQVRLVRLCGLTVRADLNGQLGKVLEQGSKPNERWNVVMRTGESIRVRPKNLRALNAPDGSRRKRGTRRASLSWQPKVGNGLGEQAFSQKAPARQVARFLGMPQIYNFATVTRSVRDALTATGKLFICGGVDSSKVLGSVECYDLSKTAWMEPPPASMVSARGGAAFCFADGTLFMCGGADGNDWLNTMERFDPWLNEWKVLPPMKTARIYAVMCSIHGMIYVCGGQRMQNTPVSCVERFDPLNRVWRDMPSMLDRRTVPMATVTGKALYVYGGVDTDYLSSLERFTPETNFWQRLPPMGHCRSYAGSTIARGHLYVCGGTGRVRGVRGLSPMELQSCERYSIKRNRWEELPPLRAPRSSCFAVAKGNVLFSSGGCPVGMPSVEALNLNEVDQWEVMGPPMTHDWTFGVVLPVAEHIYVMGGRTKRCMHQQPGTIEGGEGAPALLSTMMRKRLSKSPTKRRVTTNPPLLNPLPTSVFKCYNMSTNVWEELPAMQEARTFASGFHSIV